MASLSTPRALPAVLRCIARRIARPRACRRRGVSLCRAVFATCGAGPWACGVVCSALLARVAGH
eukprot:382176-Lingulodinium_polyedra.AAC.1